MMNRYVLQTAAGRFVSGIERGLLLVTDRIGGYPRFDGNGATNQALLFADREAAAACIASYLKQPLPRGKSHSKLVVVEV